MLYAMFGREEKGEERKGWREKWREKGKMGVWYGKKSGGKGKMTGKMGRKQHVGPSVFFPPKSGRKCEGKKGEKLLGNLKSQFYPFFF